ncbi:hypothetical protein ACHAXT_006524 [Thalassiosira profunda]
MDEYNVCDHGHYFHMDYEPDVRKAIPPNRITVFKPFMDAMGLCPTEAGTEMNDELANGAPSWRPRRSAGRCGGRSRNH